MHEYEIFIEEIKELYHMRFGIRYPFTFVYVT